MKPIKRTALATLQAALLLFLCGHALRTGVDEFHGRGAGDEQSFYHRSQFFFIHRLDQEAMDPGACYLALVFLSGICSECNYRYRAPRIERLDTPAGRVDTSGFKPGSADSGYRGDSQVKDFTV